MNEISPAEKIAIFRALAARFAPAADGAGTTSDAAAAEAAGAADAVDAEAAAAGAAARLASALPADARASFLAALADGEAAADDSTDDEAARAKIARRGRAGALDARVNPSHLVEVLGREPRAIQNLILADLPADLARRISLYLDLNFVPGARPAAESPLAALVRRRFRAHFVAFEDVFRPDAIDRLSVDGLENFTRHLGLREIALACRGIASKETLAAFLNRFDEEDAREIALYLTELDRVRPFWVAQADALVRKSWNEELPPAKLVRKIGLKLLATAFIERDETKCAYAAQKMPLRELKNWQRLVAVSRRKFFGGGDEDRVRLDKRRRVVERLAAKFAETGRL